MRLNELFPGRGAKRSPKRVGRGIGSGSGKTCGRGSKGQKSRSGGGPKAGFEGGQMPLQRRLPKFGFSSRKGRFSEQVRLCDLSRIEGDTVDMGAVKAAGLVGPRVRRVKIFLKGAVERALTVKGLALSKGARAAIEGAGGKVEE